jgi:hypothetical protein
MERIITRVGLFQLVHLDNPSQDEMNRRDEMVRNGSFFHAECPICQAQQKRGGDIVFAPHDLES